MVMTVPTQQHEPRPRGQRLENALTPAFVRNVAKAGRYGDGLPPIACNCFRIHGLLTSNRVRFPRCTPLSEREPAGPRKPSVDGPGLIASLTTPEPVVTPKPIRSRPTDAVAAAAAPRAARAAGSCGLR